MKPPLPKVAELVMYVTCGEESTPGKVYQVTDTGRVLGIVNLPFTATGIALHRQNGLMLAVPRDGGKIMRIDDSGKLSTVLEKNKMLSHPVDVACPADSDTVLVADNVGGVLAATSTAGGEPKVYHRFAGQKWNMPDMAVAATKDKNVLYGSTTPAGIFRFSGDASTESKPSLLPSEGGVAADTTSLRWAATQFPNQIYVFEGEDLVKKFRLPPNKTIYRNGPLSFAPGGNVVVLAQPADDPRGQPWFLSYGIDKDQTCSLFPWDKERICDFVVGPRMYWERNDRHDYKSTY